MESHINDNVLMNNALNVNGWQLISKGKNILKSFFLFLLLCGMTADSVEEMSTPFLAVNHIY